jgi:hypothetical protein
MARPKNGGMKGDFVMSSKERLKVLARVSARELNLKDDRGAPLQRS